MQELKYGERVLKEFNVDTDLEIWENKQTRDYKIKITLPEFCCLCPRSGYPDFATIYIEYIPNKFVVELKAIKLYINSFMSRNISHEDSINEIYSVLERKLDPKWMKIVGDFNPRGNVHTVIEITSDSVIKEPVKSQIYTKAEAETFNFEKFEKKEKSFSRDKFGSKDGRDFDKQPKRDAKNSKSYSKFDKSDKNSDKSKKPAPKKEGFKKPEFAGEKRARVIKKDK